MMMMSETFLPSFVITQLRWKHNIGKLAVVKARQLRLGCFPVVTCSVGIAGEVGGAFNPT